MKTQEITKQQKIVIDEDQLREVLEEGIKKAFNFPWSWWRIPIYVEKSGKVHSGDLSYNNSHKPGFIELIGVEPWSVEWDMVADLLGYDSVDELTEREKKLYKEYKVYDLFDYYLTEIKELAESGEYNDNCYNLIIEIEDFFDEDVRIAVYEDEESDKIVKFISYNDLRNDIKQIFDSITGAYQDDEGDIVFVDDQNNYYK
jgi:hypothetical protein